MVSIFILSKPYFVFSFLSPSNFLVEVYNSYLCTRGRVAIISCSFELSKNEVGKLTRLAAKAVESYHQNDVPVLKISTSIIYHNNQSMRTLYTSKLCTCVNPAWCVLSFL